MKRNAEMMLSLGFALKPHDHAKGKPKPRSAAGAAMERLQALPQVAGAAPVDYRELSERNQGPRDNARETFESAEGADASELLEEEQLLGSSSR